MSCELQKARETRSVVCFHVEWKKDAESFIKLVDLRVLADADLISVGHRQRRQGQAGKV